MNGFSSPNYTQVPNDLFDMMGDMSMAELKVVMTIVRLTFGWHRTVCKISIRDLAEATGMSTATVMKGAEEAEKRGILCRSVDGQNTTQWSIIVDGVSESDTGCINIRDASVSESDTQVGLNKEIKDKEKNTSGVLSGQDNPISSLPTMEEIEQGLKPFGRKEVDKADEDLSVSAGLSAEEYKDRVKQSMASQSGGPDLANWPEEVRPVVSAMVEFFSLRPPDKPKRGGGQYAYWIKGARDVIEASGEFSPLEVIRSIREDYERDSKDGIPPYSVASPNSLVNKAREKAALLRGGGGVDSGQRLPRGV